MEKEKIHVTVNEDYVTSYNNSTVKFSKGDKVWDYKDDIFEYNGAKMILAHDEVFGHIIGFLPLNKTDTNIEMYHPFQKQKYESKIQQRKDK